MARDIEKEKQMINNGNRFVVNADEGTGIFLRDVDKLFHQYKNLRQSIYNTYKNYLPDPISQEELKSYIDEQFVRLVKEYDINGPVDFPGYIKTKLTYRVKHSYLKGEYRDRQRVFVPRNEMDVTHLLEQRPKMDEELDFYAALEYALYGTDFNDLEKDVLFYILQEKNDSQIEKEMKKKYKNKKVSTSQIRETIKRMQTFLKERLYESLEL